MAVGTRMQQRRAPAADWATSNYVLAAGELGVTTDTGIIKIGNGSSPWNELDPAFDSQYLPVLGTASNSDLLGGVSVNSLVKIADTDVNPTNNTYVKRTADGGIKASDATEDTELVTYQQMVATRRLTFVRTVTANATLQVADISRMIAVSHSSLTAQVNITLPRNVDVAIPIGSWIDIVAVGNGGVKVKPFDGTVGINGSSNVMPNFGTLRLIKNDTDQWIGIESKKGRLPSIKVRRTAAGDNYTAGYVFVPWDTTDTSETYNPDNEWFSIPGTGLPTARRIICNKDGEYLFNANLNVAGSNVTWARIAKMTADNSTTGMNIIGVTSANGVFCVTAKKRVAAGESFGVHHGFAAGSTGVADAESSGGNPCNFKIVRLSD